MQWILDNKEWFFSGIGIFVISGILKLISKKKSITKQSQKSGAKSINYQAGGDIHIGYKNDE